MIPGLDGLRGLAFLLVFLCHTDYFYFGWTGVILFFVLSGYLITDILLKMKAKWNGRQLFIKFYGRRFPRNFFYPALPSPTTVFSITSGPSPWKSNFTFSGRC